jgi:Flp pilus assembly protein TadD
MTPGLHELIQAAVEATRCGRPDDAEPLLRQAAQEHPEAAVPHLLLAAQFADAGQNDLAEAAYLDCLARAPGLELARFQLGLLHLTNGRAAAAEANWRPLLDRGDAHPLKSFAQGLLEILHGRAESARHLIKEGMVLNMENQDLNTDMLGVLARLDAAVASSGGEAPSGGEGGEESAQLGHFLISSYRTS